MWRSHLDADWERRKNYLIRSLFDDLLLSPVQEEDESLDSTLSRVRTTYNPPSPLPTLRSALDRPYSPLPPLIIEREPNRHDEPEEYYKQLEKKVLKIYRKLFIEGKSDISDASDAGEDDTLDISMAKRMSIGEFEDLRESQNSEDISVNDKSGRKRTVSKQDTNSEASLFIEGKSDISDDVSDAGEEDTLEISMTKRMSIGEFEDLRESQNSEDISINEKSGRKRTISEQDTNSEASETKKLKSYNRSSTEVLPYSTTDEEKHEQLCDTLSSYAGNSRNREKETEDEGDDKVSDTQYSADSGRNNGVEIEVENQFRVTLSSEPDNRNKDTRTEESEASSATSTNHSDHRIVTFRAEVHKDATDDGEVVAPPTVQLNVDITVDMTAENVSDAGLAVLKNNGVSDKSHISSLTEIIQEVEVMRTTQTRPSVGSLDHNDHSVSLHTNLIDISMDLEPNLLESVTDSSSSDAVENGVENSSRRRKRSSLSNIYEETGTQTSIDNDYYERMNRGVLRDIFVGAPKVFRLCSCVDHHCACD